MIKFLDLEIYVKKVRAIEGGLLVDLCLSVIKQT